MVRRRKKTAYEDLDEGTPSKQGKNKEQQKRVASNRKSRCDVGVGSDDGFRSKLEDGTKRIIEMAADGNCLFRALADQLYWDNGYNHEEVRSDVCDFLELHEEEFSMFLVLDETEDDEDAADFESYVSNMRESGEWGGNVELVVAARLYRRNIKVFSAAAAYTIEHGADKSAGPDLMISYHDNDHYNSLRSTSAKMPTPAIKFLPDATQKKSTDTVSTEKTEDESVVSSELTVNDSATTTSDDAKGNAPEQAIQKPRKKSGPCPCGSGKWYRRCCKDAGKKQKMLRRKVALDDDTEDTDEQPQEVEDGFKVLKI